MNTLKNFLFIFLTIFLLNACSSGAGTTVGSTGSVGLSLQLKSLATGESYQTQDGYTLEFTTFALAFSKITLSNQETQKTFAAEFATEEAADLVEVENIPAGEYTASTLTLGVATADQGIPDLEGKSILIVAQASSGSEACTLQIELVGDETLTVNSADHDVEVSAGEESELLVEIDPNSIFGNVDLPDTCTGNATLTVSQSSNTSLADAILTGFSNAGSLVLGDTAGHSHSHSH